MSSQSRNNGRRDERPTLPPIRDLLQDLRRPHDSSSMTLARLRLSDEPDNSLAYMPRPDPFSSVTFGDPNLGAPPEHRQRPPSSEQHHQYHGQVVSSHQSIIGGRWSLASLPVHASRLNERQGNEHRGSPPRAGWPSQTSLRQSTLDDYPNEHGPFQYRHADPTNRLSFDVSYQGQTRIGLHAHQPGDIVTSVTPGLSFDDEHTPVARYGSAGPSSLLPITPKGAEDKPGGSYVSKYECSYCGKGFNRPSSLKIHLNSHTGEKPFVCSVEGCGRSFSVLSNMRRHARVHSHIPAKQPDPSSDEDSEQSVTSHDPSTVTATGSDPSHPQYNGSSPRWHQRRDSTASTSSGTSSRRSHSYSSEERTDTSARPEKRLRGRPE